MLERMIAGNSAHLVLDSRCQPVDVLAGLYGPGASLELLIASFERTRSADSRANELG